MRPQPLGAVLSMSVDLPAAAIQAGETERLVDKRLVDLFAATRQPVTWFADDPAADETILLASAADSGHEAALRINADWAGDREGRSRLVAEIAGRTARARGAGTPITSLALPEAIAEVPRELSAELLVKYGITAVRAAAGENRAGRACHVAGGPVPLRYGLWLLVPDVRLNGGSRIADWRTVFGIRRAIDRCIRNARPLHLVVDTAAIARNSGPDRLGGLPAILRHVERRQAAGLLRVCTIAEVVARLVAPAAPRAAGSILRAA